MKLMSLLLNQSFLYLGLLSWFASILFFTPVWAGEQPRKAQTPDSFTTIDDLERLQSLKNSESIPADAFSQVNAVANASDIVADESNARESIEDPAGKNTAQISQSQIDQNPNPDVTDLNVLELEPASDPIGQITSVTQLSDVQPTDWAYQALQSLVERYGCIVGYPDATYRGQRALSRFEFAAGVNACLDRINELLAASTADLATKEDLATLQRLQEEFAAELVQLHGQVDALEARTSELEANQFSTTVKLSGSAIMALSDAFVDGSDNQLIGQYRYRLLLNANFTGRDSLLMGIYAGNAIGNGFDTGGFDLPGLEVTAPDGSLTETISTQEGGLTSTTGATTDNGLLFLAAGYSFPVGD